MEYQRLQRRVFDMVEGGRADDALNRIFNRCVVALILLSVTAATLETVAEIHEDYGELLRHIQSVTLAAFAIEYALRVWSATADPHLAQMGPIRGRLDFMRRPFQAFDLLAILPLFLGTADQVSALRILRLLALLKLARYSPALGALWSVIKTERRALMAAGVIMLTVIVISATLLYEIEKTVPDTLFTSIPAAMWWAIVTIATIGYGDMVPSTPLGKIVASLVMMSGIALYSLPMGILALGFRSEVIKREFVVTWRMVASAPMFARLTAAEIAEVANLLSAHRAHEGEEIIRPGDPQEAVYFIASGRVAYEESDTAVELGAGEVFGEGALLEARKISDCKATALTSTDLMILHEQDLGRLVRRNPDIARRLREAARERGESLTDDLKRAAPPSGAA